MTRSRIPTGRVLLLFAVLAGFTSFWFTLQFTWTPEFQATALPDGPTHSNYHAFRGAMLALGVNLLLAWVGIRANAIRLESWAIVVFMAVFYYAGWWLAWPIWGLHAPYFSAEVVHAVGTVCGLAGLATLKPDLKAL
ncbi:hypothetical protein [Roseibium album]|uniref:hypothetical protein n=1 Tax=Roseibium album TaxID=311410 RepID=UPI0024911FF5|nr:hypothetical protein [Roseibium album]